MHTYMYIKKYFELLYHFRVRRRVGRKNKALFLDYLPIEEDWVPKHPSGGDKKRARRDGGLDKFEK